MIFIAFRNVCKGQQQSPQESNESQGGRRKKNTSKKLKFRRWYSKNINVIK
jgi:hypothetical protein